jgi:hypothetical protein
VAQLFSLGHLARMKIIRTFLLAVGLGVLAECILLFCGQSVWFIHRPAVYLHDFIRPKTGDTGWLDVFLIVIINIALLSLCAWILIKLFRMFYARKNKPVA